MEQFRLSRGVTIQEAAKPTGEEGGGANMPAGKIYLELCDLDAEQYQISVENGSEILIRAGKSWGLSMGFYL